VCLLQSGNPADRGVEQHPVAVLRRLGPAADGQIRFPGAGRAEQDDVLRFGQEHAGAQQIGDAKHERYLAIAPRRSPL